MEQKPYIFKFLRDTYKLNYIDKELVYRKYNEKISFFSASFFLKLYFSVIKYTKTIGTNN